MTSHKDEQAHTACATCGRRMPPEGDSRTVVFCSAHCYGLDVAAHGIVHIYPPVLRGDQS